MPLIKYNISDIFPSWCEVKYYEILKIHQGVEISLTKTAQKEKLFVCKGNCSIAADDRVYNLLKGNIYDFRAGSILISNAAEPSVILRVGGDWQENIGGSGVFELSSSDNPQNIGDSVQYKRNTVFDNHFHDCDEYWFIIEGKGIAVTEGTFYDVSAGDCVITRKGDHHDFPIVYEKILGVYLETGLLDFQRTGHLWNHTHH